jgi:aminocarboxymuconate-semialdehyde decarboxylase
MNSTWEVLSMGKIIVIDMQHHYIPARAIPFVRKTAEHDYTVGLKKFAKAYEIITNIDTHLKWMDESGIDMAILSTAAFCANGYDFCRICNDGYSEIVKKYPSRFKGVIHVYPYDRNKNKDEIKRGVEELGLWGLGIVASYKKIAIDSEVMNPIYEMAVRYDMPIYVHPSIRNGLWGGERYNLNITLSREYDVAKSFVEIIYGVLPRFPELKVIFSHFGGGLPTLKGRLLAWHRPQDFHLPGENQGLGLAVEHAKELGLVDDFESKLKNILFDSAGVGGWLPVIESAFETLGCNHLCFGSDYPYELREPRYVKKIIGDINKINVSNNDKDKFFNGNLKRLFLID